MNRDEARSALDEMTEELDFEGEVADATRRIRVQDAARARVRDEDAEKVEMPPRRSLDALLAAQLPKERYLIDGVWPAGGNVLFAAQRKAGKTTVVHNLVRCLADGDSFLGNFDTLTQRRVALIDVELSEGMLRRWLRDQRISNTGGVVETVSLRGKARAFGILDDRVRDRWATRLRDVGTEVLILDPLRPVIAALGLNEWNEMGVFLDAWGSLCSDAGVTESLIAQHHGHHHERAAGDSRLVGWSDANWDLTRDDMDDPSSLRYFRAYGRDVEVGEGTLRMDTDTRWLEYLAGGSKVAKAVRLKDEVLAAVVMHPGSTAGYLQTIVAGLSKNNSRRVLDELEDEGLIRTETGTGNTRLCYPAALT